MYDRKERFPSSLPPQELRGHGHLANSVLTRLAGIARSPGQRKVGKGESKDEAELRIRGKDCSVAKQQHRVQTIRKTELFNPKKPRKVEFGALETREFKACEVHANWDVHAHPAAELCVSVVNFALHLSSHLPDTSQLRIPADAVTKMHSANSGVYPSRLCSECSATRMRGSRFADLCGHRDPPPARVRRATRPPLRLQGRKRDPKQHRRTRGQGARRGLCVRRKPIAPKSETNG